MFGAFSPVLKVAFHLDSIDPHRAKQGKHSQISTCKSSGRWKNSEHSDGEQPEGPPIKILSNPTQISSRLYTPGLKTVNNSKM